MAVVVVAAAAAAAVCFRSYEGWILLDCRERSEFEVRDLEEHAMVGVEGRCWRRYEMVDQGRGREDVGEGGLWWSQGLLREAWQEG